MPDPTIFRAPLTRAFRAAMCALLILGLAFAIRAELATPYVHPATRWGWMAPTILLELVMLVGLQRLWAVCLIINDAGVTVRNFRGDIRYRRIEIKSVDRTSDFVGFGIELRLKTGETLRLDGLTWATPRGADQAADEISEALGLAPNRHESTPEVP